MNYIKKILTYFVSIFTAIMVILGTLCYFKAIPSLTLSDSIYKILLMAIATATFVTIKDTITNDKPLLDFITGIIGCSALVLLIGFICNWMTFSWLSIILVVTVTILVYLFVWFMTALQSKKDADELNEQLIQLKCKNNKK